MHLSQLLNGLSYTLQGEGNPTILALSCDTSTVTNGCMFFCLQGSKHDGHDFFRKVVGDGAVALVCNRVLPTKVLQIVVDDTRLAMCIIAKNFYNNCVDKLRVISVVGTNGKTSTSYILESILTKSGANTAVVGTNGIYFNGQRHKTQLTTPDPIELHYWFEQMYLNGVEVVIMEVSAHAIDLRKVCGIVAEVAIFTNLSQDHLDYFCDMERYSNTKRSYFCPNFVRNAVVNVDDQLGKQIYQLVPSVSYGVGSSADFVASNIVQSGSQMQFDVNALGQFCKIKTRLCGEFNAYNILAAIACGAVLGVDIDTAVQAVEEIAYVSGRNETIYRNDGARIVVDFAHTPDGVTNILSYLKSNCLGKLIVVFGCGGNRDKLKRPLMAQEVSKFANFAILTNDNPRFEDPKLIARDIAEKLTCPYKIILNRSQATEYALSVATATDTVAILGKGAEEYQEIRGKKFPYSDVDMVHHFLKTN